MQKKQPEVKNSVDVIYQVGSKVSSGVDFCPEFYLWKTKEIEVLKEFCKDLNIVRACKDVGFKNPEVAARELMKKEAIKIELKAIYDARFKAMQMNEEMAAANHINTMNKFAEDYESADIDSKSKGSLANAVAKMSGDYLRAAGLFGNEQKTVPNVVINLNIDNDKGVIIDGHAEPTK